MDDNQLFVLKVGTAFSIEVLTHGVYIHIGNRDWFFERSIK
jgi:hypothetical protein